jgi:hypothetical protein
MKLRKHLPTMQLTVGETRWWKHSVLEPDNQLQYRTFEIDTELATGAPRTC